MAAVAAGAIAIVYVAYLLAGQVSGWGANSGGRQVVVYTSIDEMQARKVFSDFERETGIEVRPVFDTEAAKTTGLALRILAEKRRPRCDVFWNNELSRTIELARGGALDAYVSPSAVDIPAAYKDPAGKWAAFALRARVIVYNSERVQPADAPKGLHDLADPKWKGKVGIADPRFGTTATHAAALAQAWGRDKALEYFTELDSNGVRVYQGNSLVRDAAASGEILVGLTDTDDVLTGQAAGMKIGYVIPDDGDGAMGTLVIPNSVARVSGAPHPREAEALIDYLLSRGTEAKLAVPSEGWMPVRPAEVSSALVSQVSPVSPVSPAITAMKVDWDEVARLSGTFGAEVAGILIK